MYFNIIANISSTDTQHSLCGNRIINKTFVGGKSTECTYRNTPYAESLINFGIERQLLTRPTNITFEQTIKTVVNTMPYNIVKVRNHFWKYKTKNN